MSKERKVTILLEKGLKDAMQGLKARPKKRFMKMKKKEM